MHHAVQAYGKTAKTTATPRQLEAELLLKAAAKLKAIQDSWDSEAPRLDDALLYNRKLWSIFLSSVTEGGSPLPHDLRQNIANLGLFVMNQTMSLLSDPKPEKLRPLININRELASGLLARA